MEGRWRFWIIGALMCSSLGCSLFNKKKTYPDGPNGQPSIMTPEPPLASKEPLKPETLLVFGSAALDAADPKYVRTAMERERLLTDAHKNFSRVLERQPKNITAIAGIAKVHYYQGDRENSAIMYRKALELEPKNAHLWFELATVQSKLMQDYAAAIESLGEANRLEPENPLYRRWLGRTMALVGRADEGVTLLTRSMPEAEARFEVAEMLYLGGQMDAARNQLQMALRVDPNFAPALEILQDLGGNQNQPVRPVRYEEPVQTPLAPTNQQGTSKPMRSTNPPPAILGSFDPGN